MCKAPGQNNPIAMAMSAWVYWSGGLEQWDKVVSFSHHSVTN